MTTRRNTFRKYERLTRRKIISQLFKEGKVYRAGNIRAIWLETQLPVKSSPVQVLISVPRKQWKRSVDRNFIKRLIREAYRTNKHNLYETLERQGKQLALALIFRGNHKPTLQNIEQNIKQILAHIEQDTTKPNSDDEKKRNWKTA
ncbi:MAG: ribonuclease P protein component [Chlorobi bacterium]|nr:ribonuclease P protein component [Chlorobiota bacterium]